MSRVEPFNDPEDSPDLPRIFENEKIGPAKDRPLAPFFHRASPPPASRGNGGGAMATVDC
jgi:hypothetical protein